MDFVGFLFCGDSVKIPALQLRFWLFPQERDFVPTVSFNLPGLFLAVAAPPVSRLEDKVAFFLIGDFVPNVEG